MAQKKGQPAPPVQTEAVTAPAVPDQLLKEIGTAAHAKPAKRTRKTTKPDNSVPPAAAAPVKEPELPAGKSTNLDDPATDQAVNDIAVDEGDIMLTLQDVANEGEEGSRQQPKPHWFLLIILLSMLAALVLAREWLVELYQSLNINV